MKEVEERAGTSSALLFDQLDFRVTRVMILVAAARSRIANIERCSDRAGEGAPTARSDRFESENEKGGEREREREISRNEMEEDEKNCEKGGARFISRVLNLSIHDKFRPYNLSDSSRDRNAGKLCGKMSK